MGLPRDGAAAVLDDPAGKGEQLVQQELGKYAGISGVPHFVIDGRWVLFYDRRSLTHARL